MEQDQQERAGSLVAHRRFEMGVSAAALAKLADVDVKTLRSLERGERWPQDTSRAKIEAALGWIPGGLDAIRDGASLHEVLRADEFSTAGATTNGPSGRPVVDLRRIGTVLGLDIRYLDAITDAEARPLIAKLTVAFDESGLAAVAGDRRSSSVWHDVSASDSDDHAPENTAKRSLPDDVWGLAAHEDVRQREQMGLDVTEGDGSQPPSGQK